MEIQALHFAELKLAISPNMGDSGAQFLVGGDCVRASPVHSNSNTIDVLSSQAPALLVVLMQYIQ